MPLDRLKDGLPGRHPDPAGLGGLFQYVDAPGRQFAEAGREGGVLVKQVLEAGREVDLGRLDLADPMEQLVRQG